jgi:mRNA-degrading endonuclease RelE of RelBE toxin-antitoxin system
MSGANGIEVYETPTFRKAFKRLAEAEKTIVENEVDRVIENPALGERKKGDLAHLWVHKFNLNNQQALLGYSWKEAKLQLYLLNIASHENFYRDVRRRRKSDLGFIR